MECGANTAWCTYAWATARGADGSTGTAGVEWGVCSGVLIGKYHVGCRELRARQGGAVIVVCTTTVGYVTSSVIDNNLIGRSILASWRRWAQSHPNSQFGSLAVWLNMTHKAKV